MTTNMPEFSDLYSGRILELAANSPQAPRLAAPDATATAHSKLCGSVITVDLRMNDNIVTAYGHDVKACLLGQTSAAVMSRNAVGSSADELREIGRKMRRMLKENGPAPDGRWADLAILGSARDYKARHASMLLVFDAVEAAIAQIEAKSAAGVENAG